MTLLFCLLLGCREELYETCETADDCHPPSEDLTATCLPKSDEGYCTWDCTTDDDCEDEDDDDETELVCASFEDEAGSWCFPPCGDDDGCPDGFTCRSTGGGSSNEKVCFPSE